LNSNDVAMKIFKNLTFVLRYLQSKQKLLWQTRSVYEDQFRGTFFNWFTPVTELNEGVENLLKMRSLLSLDIRMQENTSERRLLKMMQENTSERSLLI